MKTGPMKNVVAALLFCCAQTVSAEPAGPEYVGVFVQLDTATGQQTSLERQIPQARMRTKAFGVGGGSGEYEFQGAHSSTRFRAGRPLTFLVRVESQSHDPHSLIQFYKLDVTSKTRRMVTVTVGIMGLGGHEKTQDYAMPYDAAKYGHDFFRITISGQLQPGEYALSTADAAEGYLFGIGP
jgi:hypothetical protein